MIEFASSCGLINCKYFKKILGADICYPEHVEWTKTFIYENPKLTETNDIQAVYSHPTHPITLRVLKLKAPTKDIAANNIEWILNNQQPAQALSCKLPSNLSFIGYIQDIQFHDSKDGSQFVILKGNSGFQILQWTLDDQQQINIEEVFTYSFNSKTTDVRFKNGVLWLFSKDSSIPYSGSLVGSLKLFE